MTKKELDEKLEVIRKSSLALVEAKETIEAQIEMLNKEKTMLLAKFCEELDK